MTRARRILLGVAAALSGLLAAEAWRPSGPIAREVSVPRDARWIRTADEVQTTGCFRHEVMLGQETVHAWAAVAAEGGFELVINGNPVGGFSLWRPTRPFQNGLSEAGQRIYGGEPAMALNFPREYQWSLHRNGALPVWFDLRPFLRHGLNTIAVETDARGPGARLLVFGEIELADGSFVPLRSGPHWIAEPVPRGVTQFEWTEPQVRLRDWRKALDCGPAGELLRALPDGAFRRRFDAPLFTLAPEEMGKQDLVYRFERPAGKEAFLRILANAPYRAWLNGHPVQPRSRAPLGLADGGWQVSWDGRRPLAVMPTLLDDNEVSGAWGGERFLDPRHGDPTAGEFRRFRNEMNRTGERPSANRQGELLFDQYGEKEQRGRASDTQGFLEEPIARVPTEAVRERTREEFSVFGVERLLRQGTNELRVRLASPAGDGYGRTRPGRIAIDGWSGTGAGWREFTGAGWLRTTIDAENGAHELPTARARSAALPPLKFLGHADRSSQRRLIAPLLGLLVFFAAGRIGKRFLKNDRWVAPAAAATLVMAGFFAAKAALLERSEFFWFMRPEWPWVALGSAALAAALMALWGDRGGDSPLSPIPDGQVSRAERRVLMVLLLLTFALRIWRVDFQPVDDDEFASIQASVAIADKGVPEIGEGIWYTRSPLYHYPAGLVAFLFGKNLWALRGFSVLAAVATGWVLWALARSVFRDPRVALGALLLYALHPFLIFSAHIARFYQQQQLFLLIGVWTFIRGFIHVDGGERWRLASMTAFTAAVLSQEISLTMVPVVGLAYVLFGRRTAFRSDFRLALGGLAAGLLVFLDIIAFQVKCLTRSVGISPNVEATIAPTFWEPGNFFAMAVGYSRLHLVLSAFVLVSLVAALRSKSREMLALHLFTFGGIAACNLLITSVSFRYQYTLVALWILLGTHGIAVAARGLAGALAGPGHVARLRSAAAVAMGLVVIVSWSPWRIPGSYGEKLLGDPVTPLRHAAAMMVPGDKVMITEPHPHAAKMELGRVDYDLTVPLLHDFTYRDPHGVLRDRNGDAEVIDHIGRLQQVFARGDRVWILLNREKFRSRGKNLRWEYPGAREELFIRRNCDLVFRSHLWHLYLWDPSAGRYHAFRQEPGSWVD